MGFGCTEAPRGICWHRYEFEDDGTLQDVRIVPPTSQNHPVSKPILQPSLLAYWINLTKSSATIVSRASAITIPVSPVPRIS